MEIVSHRYKLKGVFAEAGRIDNSTVGFMENIHKTVITIIVMLSYQNINTSKFK